jgi:hypothetical protein
MTDRAERRRWEIIIWSTVGVVAVGLCAVAFLPPLWRDKTGRTAQANRELADVAATLRQGTTLAQLQAAVSQSKYLRLVHNSGHWWVLSTPHRPFADQWNAWTEVRGDGTLVRALFGTADTLSPEPRPSGMPGDLCLGTPSECSHPLP